VFLDVKLGGNQIEYEDEDPSVRQMLEEACVKTGVKNLMEKYYKQSAEAFKICSISGLTLCRKSGAIVL
jgi:hypothetical protein